MPSPKHRSPARRSKRTRPHVVVLGAGFAGIRAALALAANPELRVTLIDRTRRPALKTRLHELRERVPELPVAPVFRGTGVRFLCGEILAIDRAERRVQVGQRSVGYDWLVVALGSRTSDLGVPGVQQHALCLDTAEDARRFSRRVAQLARRGGRLVVVGAGPTGVEAAAEAATRLSRGQVLLLEAAARILPHFARLPALYAQATLRWLGVEVRTRARVERVEPDAVLLRRGERVACAAVLWCAGIEPNPLLAKAGLAPPGRRAPVDRYLVSKVDPQVYVVGDAAAVPGQGGGRPSAQLAVQQGEFVARDLGRRLRGESREPFEPQLLGELLSLGPWKTTGSLRLGALELPLVVVGPLAQVVKQAGVLRHQAAVAWSSLALRGRRVLRGDTEAAD